MALVIVFFQVQANTTALYKSSEISKNNAGVVISLPLSLSWSATRPSAQAKLIGSPPVDGVLLSTRLALKVTVCVCMSNSCGLELDQSRALMGLSSRECNIKYGL